MLKESHQQKHCNDFDKMTFTPLRLELHSMHTLKSQCYAVAVASRMLCRRSVLSLHNHLHSYQKNLKALYHCYNILTCHLCHVVHRRGVRDDIQKFGHGEMNLRTVDFDSQNRTSPGPQAAASWPTPAARLCEVFVGAATVPGIETGR